LNKHQLIAFLAFVAVAAIITVLYYFANKYGWFTIAISIAIFAIFLSLLFFVKRKVRYSILLKKYNDEILVKKIVKRTLWQGQTAEQLIDALGEPSIKNQN